MALRVADWITSPVTSTTSTPQKISVMDIFIFIPERCAKEVQRLMFDDDEIEVGQRSRSHSHLHSYRKKFCKRIRVRKVQDYIAIARQ